MSRDRAQTMLDAHEITDVLMRWGYARDADDWEALAACYHDDATMNVSWLSATAAEFVDRSKEMAANRPPGSHMKHQIGGPIIDINGNRAFSRCHSTLYIRAIVDGYEFDFESLFRFFDLFERRDDSWRFFRRTSVYEKDRMDPVCPARAPSGLVEDLDLSAFQPEVRFLSYFLCRAGYEVLPVPVVYSREEADLRRECEDWLTG